MNARRQIRVARWWPMLAVAGAVALLLPIMLREACCDRAARPVPAPPSDALQAVVPVRAPLPGRMPEVVGVRPARVLAAAAGTGRVEVCGYGAVELPPDDPDPVQRIPAPLRQSALEAMDALMLASDDVQVRAAALWMGARLRGRDVHSRVEQVARLAVASQDPFVYALALEACKGLSPPDSGSCALLSPAQWVRLDPDNAVPWQALAAEARAHGQTQDEDTALAFAARAPHSDVHAGRLPGLVDKALGPQAAALQRTLALSAGWSAEAVWAASHGVPVLASVQGYDLSCGSVALAPIRKISSAK